MGISNYCKRSRLKNSTRRMIGLGMAWIDNKKTKKPSRSPIDG